MWSVGANLSYPASVFNLIALWSKLSFLNRDELFMHKAVCFSSRTWADMDACRFLATYQIKCAANDLKTCSSQPGLIFHVWTYASKGEKLIRSAAWDVFQSNLSYFCSHKLIWFAGPVPGSVPGDLLRLKLLKRKVKLNEKQIDSEDTLFFYPLHWIYRIPFRNEWSYKNE